MAAELKIITVVYDPAGNDVAGEYVELANRGDTARLMQDWTLSDIAGHGFG